MNSLRLEHQSDEYWLVSIIGCLVSWLVGWIDIDTISEAIQAAIVWSVIGLVVKKAEEQLSKYLKSKRTNKSKDETK